MALLLAIHAATPLSTLPPQWDIFSSEFSITCCSPFSLACDSTRMPDFSQVLIFDLFSALVCWLCVSIEWKSVGVCLAGRVLSGIESQELYPEDIT